MASEPKATLGEARDRFMREVWGEEWTRDRSGEPPAFREILNSLAAFEIRVAIEAYERGWNAAIGASGGDERLLLPERAALAADDKEHKDG